MPNVNTNTDEINLLEYWAVIKKRRKYIAGFVSVVVVTTIIISLFMPKYYKATAVIMSFGNQGGGAGMAALAGSLGGLASLAGIGGAGTQTPAQQFIALLKTRTLAEDIINKLNLMPFLFKNYDPQKAIKFKTEGAVQALLGSVNFMDDKKNGTITLSGEFNDPKLAADVVNGYVDGLQRFINENSFTMSKRNRIFIEKQLEQNKRELLESGKALNDFYKTGRISSVDSKVDVPIGIQINANAEVANVEERISAGLLANVGELQKQKQDIELNMVVKDVPQQVYLQYLTLRRNLLAQINTLLTQQYEIAKIEEAKNDLAFQVIDPARVPEQRSRPKRKQMVVKAFMASLLIGVFAAFFVEYLEKMKGKVKGDI